MNRALRNLIFLIIIFGTVYSASAADNKHFKATAQPSKLQVKANESFQIQLLIDVEKGWHIYGFAPKGLSPDSAQPTWTELSIQPDKLVKISGKIKSTKPKIKLDSSFTTAVMRVPTFYGKAEFLIPVTALKDINFNKEKIEIVVYAQQCTEQSCLVPDEFNTKVSDQVFAAVADTTMTDEQMSGSPVAQSTNDTKKSTSNVQVQQTESQQQNAEVRKRGIWSYIWFAMLQGALSLMTPCVFPMIPITVSFFTKRTEKKKSKGLKDSIVYALGIMFTFTGIGIIFAAIYGPAGIQNLATNPWLNIAIAAIFIVFAMNLFGAFEIQLPTGLLNKLNQKSQGSGIMSVLLMGLTFSLTSFTCTVPFVGTTLVSVGSGEWFYPIIGMLAFSAVFAAPFFLLALFPSAMNKMPKAGGWMNNVKVVMGFLEIAAAIKFISNADLVWTWGILPREFFLSIWIACLIMIILYILGIYKLHHDAPVESVGSPRIIISLIFAAITIWFMTGLFGKPLGELDAFLPPPDYQTLMNPGAAVQRSSFGTSSGEQNNQSKSGELVWLDNYETGLKLAKEQNKKLFVDFTGFTCTNCRWMELNLFSKPEVRSALSDMVLVRLYTDRRVEPYLSNKKFQNDRFNSIELPLYVLYSPDEQLIGTKTFTRDQNEFLNFLKAN